MGEFDMAIDDKDAKTLLEVAINAMSLASPASPDFQDWCDVIEPHA